MESVLKMSNVMDLKVFILFEDVEKKRHFGGHEDLCDLYNDGILEAQKGWPEALDQCVVRPFVGLYPIFCLNVP